MNGTEIYLPIKPHLTFHCCNNPSFSLAWCLGSQKAAHTRSRSGGSLNEMNGNVITLDPTSRLSINEGNLSQLHGSEWNLYLSSLAGFRHHHYYNSNSTASLSGVENSYLRMNSDERKLSPSKYSLDERVLIEQLLQRVIRRGSKPATKAQYGSTDDDIRVDIETDDHFASSPSALATAVERGLVPVDPVTGFHSTGHLDCITSPQTYGFLPLNNSGDPYQEKQQTDAPSLFLTAPIFLDALLSIADDLMDTPKSNRTAELRRRLQSLEVELLPSNVVYLPIGLANLQHRVWRIVSNESIALSTNERVPCIVTMEVIDYGATNSTSASASGDSKTLSAWVNNARPPKRHITLIDKVATYTQEGLKMLDDRFSQHGDGKGKVFERRLSDFLQLSQKYSPVQQTETIKTSIDNNKEEAFHENDSTDYIELGPPPLGSPTLSVQDEEQNKPVSLILSYDEEANDHEHAATTSPLDAPRTPNKQSETKPETSPMGQWSTPTTRKPSVKLRKRMNETMYNVAEEDVADNFSPQAKQRKKVSFPSNKIQQDGSLSGEDASQAPSVGQAPTVVFKEDWKTKTERLRKSSIYGSHDGWRLMPILIKSNDDLRQEQLASQLIQRMALILARANIPVWLKPYEIVALTGRGGSK